LAPCLTGVPAGTLTCTPSIASATDCVLSRFGVPRSVSNLDRMEVLLEVIQGAQHRVGGESAQGAERAVDHRVAEIAQQHGVFFSFLIPDNSVDHLDPAGGADAARRALAAGLDGAELHRVAR